MPPTLASLVRNPALKLTVLAGQDGLDVPVRWVHTSELDDPAPFLEGGELLLTTGLKLPDAASGQRAYVHRLADAGVVGLGFGIGLSHEEVPGPLADAAEERGLPLLRVPQPTPFIAISKAVSAALAAEQYRAVTMTSQAQQELTRAALGPDGSRALLGRLAQRLDGWAALYH
ncbi:PucR family transcriptional regulator ligand-binding domain-containing protein, partial [Streptomyces sp. NPDC059506]|uniref:PucR family transcriptional regulator ligand-binding domain-containing protein n=1 Tax=Streptomyces sp. NPDC059506 TaxID=3347751 RepID=UPI00367A541A